MNKKKSDSGVVEAVSSSMSMQLYFMAASISKYFPTPRRADIKLTA